MMWTRNWVFNTWNEKFVERQRSRTLLYTSAELFKSDEFNLSHLFKLPYKNLMEIIYAMSKDIHISYDEFNKMPWFEILMILDEHSEFIEAQNGENENQNDMIAAQQANMETMMANQRAAMPKFDSQPKMPQMPAMPNMSNFKFGN